MQTINNIFTSYSLTDKEKLQGTILNTDQKAVIQNMLSLVAQQKLGLKFSATQEFIQEEAYLSGQMDLLSNLLESSDAAETAVLDLASSNQ